MSKADALLASLDESTAIHSHTVSDPDSYFVIDPDSRQISNLSNIPNVLMQNDHNSEIYTFEIPRFVEGHDMLSCNRIRLHFINIDAKTKMQYDDVAELTLTTNPRDTTTLISAWTIKRHATQYVGNLSLMLQYMCIDANGEATYEWHTDIYSDIEIKKTINSGEQAVIEYSNILEEWYQRLFGMEASLVAAVEEAADAQKTAIELKGEEVLDTIPEDYTTTYNMAEEALRKKANAIEQTAEGEMVLIDDSADAHLLGLNLYGKTTQVTTTGKNLLENTGSSHTSAGITYTRNDDGTVYATGTATDTSVYVINSEFEFIGGFVYILTGCPAGGGTNSYRIDDVSRLADDGAGGQVGYGEDTIAQIRIRIAKGVTVNNLLFKPMIRYATNDDPTYEPYTGYFPSPRPDWPQDLVSIESFDVKIHGKNLCDIAKATGIGNTSVVTVSDNCASIAPNASAYGFQLMYDNGNVVLKKGVTYSYSCDYKGSYGSSWGWRFKRVDGNWTTPTNRTSGTITPDVDIEQVAFYLGFPYNLTAEGKLSNVQVEIADKATEYEPHKTMQTITTTRTLPGIPVSQNGNYTDDKGQQWICDEIDFERGVYIQRIISKTLDGNLGYQEAGTQIAGRYTAFVSFNDIWTYTGDTFMSDRFMCYPETEYRTSSAEGIYVNPSDTVNRDLVIIRVRNNRGVTNMATFRTWIAENPVIVLCRLKTPIETALTDEEITLYKRLKTNYYNTTILNDAGAHMVVKYNADTKMFFENHSIATDAQVQSAVDAYLTNYLANAEEVSF